MRRRVTIAAIVALLLLAGSLSRSSVEAQGGFSNDTLWWPDSTTTGYTHAPGYPGSLTVASSGSGTCPTALASNHTYSFCEYDGITSIGTSGSHISNVTFIGCLFKVTNQGGWNIITFGTNIAIYFSTVQPNTAFSPPISLANSYQYGIAADNGNGFICGLTVMYTEFWGFGNAIDSSGSSQTCQQIFKDNYVHDAADPSGSTYHHDGFGCENSAAVCTESYVTVDHNNIQFLGNTNSIAYQAGTYNNFTITRNLVGGDGFTDSLWAALGGGNHTWMDNTYDTAISSNFGPFHDTGAWTLTGDVYRRNRWKVPGGASWGTAGNDGLFWKAVSSSCAHTPCAGSDDNSFVGATDSTAVGIGYPYYATQIQATPSSTQASVSFTAPTDNGGSAITGYRVSAYQTSDYRQDYTIANTSATGASSPIVVTGLTNGATYVFTVAAQNSSGLGPALDGYGYESAPSGAVTIGSASNSRPLRNMIIRGSASAAFLALPLLWRGRRARINKSRQRETSR